MPHESYYSKRVRFCLSEPGPICVPQRMENEVLGHLQGCSHTLVLVSECCFPQAVAMAIVTHESGL
jgi:hypothetical protein